jgi:hypothetical protein
VRSYMYMYLGKRGSPRDVGLQENKNYIWPFGAARLNKCQ